LSGLFTQFRDIVGIGNVTHFKKITSLKQRNLHVVSLTSSFYISLTLAYFCSTSYHRQLPH